MSTTFSTTTPISAERTDQPELIAGRYRVEQHLAVGGMGEVLAVSDTSTGRRLAFKRLLDAEDPRLKSMFEREYHTLVSLKHPRIIEVFDYGIAEGRPYYTMECSTVTTCGTTRRCRTSKRAATCAISLRRWRCSTRGACCTAT